MSAAAQVSTRCGTTPLQTAGTIPNWLEPGPIDASQYVWAGFGTDDPVRVGATTMTSKGGEDSYVLRFDPRDGRALDAIQLAGPNTDRVTGLLGGADGLVVSGTFAREITVGATRIDGADADGYIASLSGVGWQQSVTGSDRAQSFGVPVAEAGGTLLVAATFLDAGRVGDLDLTSDGETDAELFRVSGDGAMAPIARFGGVGWVSIHHVVATASGDILVAGQYDSDLTVGTEHLTAATSEVHSELFVARLDAEGRAKWVRQFGTELDDGSVEIVDRPEATYVAGVAVGTIHAGAWRVPSPVPSLFILRLSRDGEFEDVVTYGGPDVDALDSIRMIGTADALVIAGQFAGTLVVEGTRLDGTGTQPEIFLSRWATTP